MLLLYSHKLYEPVAVTRFIMLKRFSTFRRKKTEDLGLANGNGVSNGGTDGSKPNGTHVVNGTATANGHTESSGSNGTANGQRASKRFSVGGAAKRQWSEPDHSVTRGDVDSSFTQFAQLIHASSRPLPTQTGDGSYIEHEAPSSLFQDLMHLGFKDFKTLEQTIMSKATGALADDKTMLMERIIQVGVSAPDSRPHAQRSEACGCAPIKLVQACQFDQCIPQRALGQS